MQTPTIIATFSAMLVINPVQAATLPPEIQGLWVEGQERECPDLMNDEDAAGMGEGALLLHGDKYYSHESLCRATGRIIKSCCDTNDTITIATGYVCGRYRSKVVFFLQRFKGDQMLIEVVPENASSGPIVKTYKKKCR